MSKPLIEVRISDEEMEALGQNPNGKALSQLFEREAVWFEEWAQRNLGGRLTRLELNTLKSYLFSKIVGDVGTLPQTTIDVIHEMTKRQATAR